MRIDHRSMVQTLVKHRVALICVAAFLVAVGSYAVWSKVAWDAYKTTYEKQVTTTKRETEAALSLPSGDNEERQKKIQAFERVAAPAQKDDMCYIHPLVAWQQHVFDDLSKRQQACALHGKSLKEVRQRVDAIISYIKNERALSDILSKTKTVEVTEATMEPQTALWTEAVSKINALSVHSQFISVKERALEKTRQVESAWKEALEAHKAQNRANYEAAQSTLVKAYASLSGINDEDSKQFTKLVTAFSDSYRRL
jgi:hypothetical protein